MSKIDIKETTSEIYLLKEKFNKMKEKQMQYVKLCSLLDQECDQINKDH